MPDSGEPQIVVVEHVMPPGVCRSLPPDSPDAAGGEKPVKAVDVEAPHKEVEMEEPRKEAEAPPKEMEEQKAPEKKYPPPDHDEPLTSNEKQNIALGYAFGLLVLVLSVVADEKVTGWSGDLSDWAQRMQCEGCPRHPEGDCTHHTSYDMSRLNVSADDGDDAFDDHFIDCPADLGDWMLWFGIVGAVAFNCLLSYGAGRLHLANPTKWKVNYTRKISHFTMFMMQIVVRYLVKTESHTRETVSTVVAMSTLYMMLYHFIFLKPMRKRFETARVIFASLDRPGDRPYTLRWLTTQNIAYFIVFVPLMYCLIATGKFQLYFIPTLVVGLGDGLAEPVGVTWGKHKYKARAVWYKGRCCNGEFTRSLEGSACVFLATILAVGVMYTEFDSPAQFGVAMGVLPITMTLSEAFAPHTWDSPFLFGIGGAVIFAITFI
eukprot:TRINITY_DN3562_c0_g1_i1.p2 TRINITY_DN3562_c0_g1~~TRINITY_DN3562_c0_g1_i1.p2  ORF type:complete len:455 (+),score=165.10 TRINITY_DN3562_c0_g1_i1:68-1366(+)